MAVKQGSNVATVKGQTDQTSGNIDPRSGTAKHPQTSFPIKEGMKDQVAFGGASPGASGTGPDASSSNPLDPEPSDKLLRRQPDVLKANPGTLVDGNGNGLDANIGGAVLGEAILSGSAKLPA